MSKRVPQNLECLLCSSLVCFAYFVVRSIVTADVVPGRSKRDNHEIHETH